MKTPHPLYNDRLTVYTCELTTCALCGASLVERGYQSSPKTIFTTWRRMPTWHSARSSVPTPVVPGMRRSEVGRLATLGAAL